MAVSRYDGRGNHVRVNCCSALMKECLEVIDSEASYVLQCEDLEDLDLSALNLVVCRETLNVKSETEVFNALVRWSGRECKRQRLEMTNGNRRKVLEGCQYLVRYVKTENRAEVEFRIKNVISLHLKVATCKCKYDYEYMYVYLIICLAMRSCKLDYSSQIKLYFLCFMICASWNVVLKFKE